jgi:hypothetical protein
MITIDELFHCDPLIQYHKIEDKFFTKGSNFMLEKMYHFDFETKNCFYLLEQLNIDSNYEDTNQGAILKLNSQYYFVFNHWVDKYKNERADFYQLAIDEEKLVSILSQNNIQNYITLPVEVSFHYLLLPSTTGFNMYANALPIRKSNMLARFCTYFKDNMADGFLTHSKENYLKAFEIIEKQYLERHINEVQTKIHKIKL